MISFTVDGTAVPKQRPRISGRRAYTPRRTMEYEERVRDAFRSSYHGFFPAYGADVPVRVSIEVYQAIPKSWSKKKRQQAEAGEIVPLVHNGDVDNIAKSIMDALNGYAYLDDCQVVRLEISKVYAKNPRAAVRICEEILEK